jgi:hypothetical protein
VSGRRRRNYGRRRRRNPGPTLFGHKAYGKQAATMIAGGLVGVAAAKLIPTLIPASLTPSQTGTTGVLIRTAITGASAIVASMIASKVMPGPFADGVLFGGLMQTGSTLLNAVLPGLKIAGVPVALSGMGEYMPALFSQPSNPLRGVPAPVPAQARVNMSGLGRAYGVAY